MPTSSMQAAQRHVLVIEKPLPKILGINILVQNASHNWSGWENSSTDFDQIAGYTIFLDAAAKF